MSASTWISICVAASGFFPLLMVLYKISRNKKLKRTGIPVTGVIDELNERVGHRGNYYTAVVRYPVQGSGNLRAGLSITRHVFTSYYKGKTVELVYDKKKPKRFILKDGPTYNGWLIFTGIIAIAYIIICFLLFRFMEQNLRID